MSPCNFLFVIIPKHDKGCLDFSYLVITPKNKNLTLCVSIIASMILLEYFKTVFRNIQNGRLIWVLNIVNHVLAIQFLSQRN